MAKGRNFSRVERSKRISRNQQNQTAWGLLQRDRSAATLGSPRQPSKAELRRQAQDAWEQFTSPVQRGTIDRLID